MPSPRQSTSSGHSCDATVIGNGSIPPSPSKVMGHGAPRMSFGDTAARPRSTRTASLRSSQANDDDDYVPGPRHGWPRLAEKMAKVPEFAAFPRFKDLNVKSLLFYQVQLKSIRLKILRMEEEEGNNMERYDHLVDDVDSAYHNLLLQLRSLLREYSKSSPALVAFSMSVQTLTA